MAHIHLSTVLVILGVIAFINVFFGYWRANTRRLSKQWLLAIHIPVPISIILRMSFLGWSWPLLPAFVGAFAIGQFAGGQIRKALKRQKVELTSFMALDFFKVCVGLGKSLVSS